MSAIADDVRREMLEADVDRCGPAARAMFDELIAKGETPEWAAMCACRQPPGSKNTDRAFSQGQQRKMERMNPLTRQKMQVLAKRAGINTDGKYYMSGLGKYDNPAAWVSCAEDVVTSCKVQNLSVEGAVNHTPRNLRPETKAKSEPALAEPLIAEMTEKYLKNDPGLREKVAKNKHARQELREKVIEKHGRPKRPAPSRRKLKLS